MVISGLCFLPELCLKYSREVGKVHVCSWSFSRVKLADLTCIVWRFNVYSFEGKLLPSAVCKVFFCLSQVGKMLLLRLCCGGEYWWQTKTRYPSQCRGILGRVSFYWECVSLSVVGVLHVVILHHRQEPDRG
jgi:hypothetical protein